MNKRDEDTKRVLELVGMAGEGDEWVTRLCYLLSAKLAQARAEGAMAAYEAAAQAIEALKKREVPFGVGYHRLEAYGFATEAIRALLPAPIEKGLAFGVVPAYKQMREELLGVPEEKEKP